MKCFLPIPRLPAPRTRFLGLTLVAALAVAVAGQAQPPPLTPPSDPDADTAQDAPAGDDRPRNDESQDDRQQRTPVPFGLQDPADRGELLRVPTVAGEDEPLFALAPVVAGLGGRLEVRRGDSYALTLRGQQILFGPEIETVAVGTDILSLGQAPRLVDGEIYVPLDFLRDVYGRLTDVTFTRERDGLRVRRSQTGRLQVDTDVVHLQGVTTVVLEFSGRPVYRIEERALGVDVVLQGATATGPDRRPQDDPLVDRVTVEGRRISLDHKPGVRADSYTLEDPFRIVFDVVRDETGPRPGADPGSDTVDPFAARRPEPPEGIRTIVLDPGHGGSESGAVGPSGVEEKDLTLLLARALKSRLESALGVRVILTRDEDASLPHATRTAIANQNKADLFISLHLNSAFGASARGAETYFLSTTASDERAARSAEEENRTATAGGAPQGDDPLYDLQLILWDLAQSHFLGQSQRLGTLIQGELNSALDLRDRGVKQAPFVVLMGAAMPAVLVEAGFISNPEEEERLQDPAYRAQLADALVRAIGAYKAEVEGRDGNADDSVAAGDSAQGGPSGGAAGDGR